MAEEKMERRGLSKMAPAFEKRERPEMKAGAEDHPEHGDGKTTTITHNEDGSHTVNHADGEVSEHPDHLHLASHLAHKLSGGDKHHIVHHDGMEAHSHSVHEDGQHEDHEGNSAEDAKNAMDKFLGEEAQEPMHQGGEESEMEPAYGGM